MTNTLVIAEKPSVAREIAALVGAKVRKNGYFEGGGYVVSWCVGHLVSLAQPRAYDEKYKVWRVEDLPIFPSNWIYTVNKETSAQFDVLKSLMDRRDVTGLVCATDAGREGEHIFRLVYHQAGCKKPFRRLWVASLEESALREGMANLKDGSAFDALAAAADCRAKADWLVGLNASRIFFTGVGRVQSPTLALVVRREEEIGAFKPSFSYAVKITCGGFAASSEKFETAAEADALCKAVTGETAVITKITKSERKAPPPKLYDLTTLQRDANRMFGLSAKQTLDIAQNLYDKKRLTYPRTDSSYLTEDMEESTRGLVFSLNNHPRFPFAAVESADIRRVINSAKVSDHHALLPTPGVAKADLSQLTDEEMLILSLVVCRLFAAVSLPEISIKLEAEAECGGAIFKAKGKTVISSGWKAVQDAFRATCKQKPDTEEGDPEPALPALSEGQRFPRVDAKVDTIKSSPPAHFTEDTLLAAMERAGNNEYDDPDIEKKGLGTPATMAETIEKLVTGSFLERAKKQLLPTQKGRNLIKLLPSSLTSPQITVDWETSLQRLARGEGSAEAFMRDVRAFVCTLIAEYDTMTPEQKALLPPPKKRESLGPCPRCGSPVYAGKAQYYCSNSARCAFFISEEPMFFKKARKKVTKSMASDFLTKGKTAVKGLYSEKKDVTYDATVAMEDTGEKWMKFKPVFEDSGKKTKAMPKKK
jgi:DNA topoisomerase-3